jgi:hypothetical protein
MEFSISTSVLPSEGKVVELGKINQGTGAHVIYITVQKKEFQIKGNKKNI